MAEYTLTYDEKVRGWTSFHSYIPEYMTALNNDFFTFKNGQLYQHNKTTGNRNTFYGTSYNTEVEISSNAAPSEIKIYKTIEIEGNSPGWDVTVITDLDRGHIDKTSFVKNEESSNTYNEGIYSTFIRRNTEDEVKTELLSVQGIGNLDLIAGTTYTFGTVPTTTAVGDALYQPRTRHLQTGALTPALRLVAAGARLDMRNRPGGQSRAPRSERRVDSDLT